jgi:hypothetical protein
MVGIPRHVRIPIEQPILTIGANKLRAVSLVEEAQAFEHGGGIVRAEVFGGYVVEQSFTDSISSRVSSRTSCSNRRRSVVFSGGEP